MQQKMNYVDIETRQYYHQANLVYLSTIALDFIIVPILFFTDSMIAFYGNLIGMVIALLAVYLNKRKLYGISSFLFILTITLLGVIQVLLFGLNSGFMYYFFNMSVLIVYTKWPKRLKLLGVIMEIVFFLGTFLYAIGNPPIHPLTDNWITFLHILNFLLNITGVANSAYYYIRIASDAQQALSKLAATDYLTGVNNRISFDAYMKAKKTSFHKTKRPFGILMIDVDHFKMINDKYGHECGDSVLVGVSKLLKEERGNQDYVARYGGEEFVYMTDIFQTHTLSEIAENLRKRVESHVFMYQNKAIKATISIGGVFISRDSKASDENWLSSADQCLYQAKSEGRNRVIVEALV
ncbi:GGDEF domain-containing protein [Acholeplasma vituli]|uniref:GGDEF domain-containing protein n=1 Tax=Paracholeplasma vituli TaxID=69473 RepID=A0ABT2PVF2_9MOLU|nr:GGDEF domain-containing protein [Paracholeplasma vituli]MCU0104931.1 GGDEF domain-containing protein [Paracholeplasma vituli]